jgi:hypothetical protein
MINRDDLVEGRRFLAPDPKSSNPRHVTVVALGNELVAVRYDDNEIAVWDLGTALDRWQPASLERPGWLDDMWVNVYGEHFAEFAGTAKEADKFADDKRIGRVCLGTGQWVPCDGDQTLDT